MNIKYHQGVPGRRWMSSVAYIVFVCLFVFCFKKKKWSILNDDTSSGTTGADKAQVCQQGGCRNLLNLDGSLGASWEPPCGWAAWLTETPNAWPRHDLGQTWWDDDTAKHYLGLFNWRPKPNELVSWLSLLERVPHWLTEYDPVHHLVCMRPEKELIPQGISIGPHLCSLTAYVNTIIQVG